MSSVRLSFGNRELSGNGFNRLSITEHVINRRHRHHGDEGLYSSPPLGIHDMLDQKKIVRYSYLVANQHRGMVWTPANSGRK